VDLLSRSSNTGRLWALAFAVALLVSLMSSAAAQAKWASECTLASHCYGTIYHDVDAYASIDAVDGLSTNVPEWESGAFVSQDEWISFGLEAHWIETGQIVGDGYDAYTTHPFYAEYTKEDVWHETISPEEIPNDSTYYNYFLLFDPAHNGVWEPQWGCDPWGHYDLPWCVEASYGGGWPAEFTEQEARTEVSSGTQPTDYGRQEVAWTMGGEWFPWTGAKWYASPGAFDIKSNPTDGAAGDIEWLAINDPPAVAPAYTFDAKAAPTETVEETGNLTADAPIPRGAKEPEGNYRIVTRYVGTHAVAEETLWKSKKDAENEGAIAADFNCARDKALVMKLTAELKQSHGARKRSVNLELGGAELALRRCERMVPRR
jgi:hypothetical protein